MQMIGVFAQFKRSMISERTKSVSERREGGRSNIAVLINIPNRN